MKTAMQMITGASGLVGSHLAGVLPDAVALTHRDLDITDADAVRRVRADVIFNCAVIGVDDCEADPAHAEQVNVEGPRNLAQTGAIIVHFSTNYVFDGEADVPYTTNDLARPINVYGRTKLDGERAVLEANERAIIVRTSWVFGDGKQSFLSTCAAKLARGERVQAIGDTFASTTFVEDLVTRTLDLVRRQTFGVHHIVNEGVCSHETFAREAARLVGVDDRTLIERRTEASMNRLARRPRWTPMLPSAPMRPWQDALAEFAARPRSDPSR